MTRWTRSLLLLAGTLTAAGCDNDAQVQNGTTDAGPIRDNVDAGDAMIDAAIGSVLVDDAAVASSCGRWVPTRKSDRPPADAEKYGMESNGVGEFSQYVCRFKDTLDGRPIVLQGKGVFGFSCYAVLPAGATTPPRVQPSDDFEVLTGTKDCARMLPFDPALRLLPTGVDVEGNRTYSCRAVVDSLDVPGKSMPLGRYDPARRACIFEWYSNVRNAPGLEGDTFEILALP